MIVNERIKKIIDHYNLSYSSFSEKIGLSNNVTISNIVAGRKSAPSYDTLVKIAETFPEISEKWLLKGEGDMLIDTNNTRVNEPFEHIYVENSNSNSFVKLENGQYVMTMPLAEFSIQAGLLDNYQDLNYFKDLDKHSIIVDEPVKGRYIAFRVKGDSMDNGTSDAILPNSIVAARELQRTHWKSKLRTKDFPYWIIYTTESKFPLLKQIIDHDAENGIIKCHSLNDGPEYNDFDLSLNDVQALFYVVDVNRSVSKKLSY